MTCQHCASGKRWTFTKGCRTCLVRWVNGMPRNIAHEWLDKYQTEKGRPEMLKLIEECHAANTRYEELAAAELIELEAA